MKDTIMVSLCLYNVHDVSMCVRISLLLQLVSSHLRKIFLLSMWVLPVLLCMMSMSDLTRDTPLLLGAIVLIGMKYEL